MMFVIINRTMLYFIDPQRQVEQLRSAQFLGEIQMFDLSGMPAGHDCTDGTIAFVAHKSAAT
jgi:hypothetical protein